MTITHKTPLQDCDHRSTTVQGKMVSVLHTYPGIGADIRVAQNTKHKKKNV